MLNLGVYFLRLVVAYNIYIEFFARHLSEITIYFIWPCIFISVFYWLPYRTASYLYKYAYAGSIQLWVMHNLFWVPYRKEINTHFYVAIAITFSVLLELLWKSILLVCHKLKRLRPPRLNQFDIRALLFCSYARFIPLY